jgi:hypothetical protein
VLTGFPGSASPRLLQSISELAETFQKQKMIVGADSAGQLYVNCVRLHSYNGLQ